MYITSTEHLQNIPLHPWSIYARLTRKTPIANRGVPGKNIAGYWILKNNCSFG